MRISRIKINNFRNFHHCEFKLDQNTVIVGENKVGKSNLIHALRLVLDPKLSDFDRQLRLEDFWDQLPRPLTREDRIRIEVDLTDFESNPNQLAILSDYLIEAEPMVSRLCYSFQPISTATGDPKNESDYEFICYGGTSEDNAFGMT